MLLSYLTNPGQATTSSDAVSRLRKWFRWFDRTVQMGATLPDVSLLTHGLDQMCQQLLTTMPHVMFRMNIVRTQCAIDHNPTLQGLSTFARALQAELETAAIGLCEEPQLTKKQRLQALRAEGKGAGQSGTVQDPPPAPKATGGKGLRLGRAIQKGGRRITLPTQGGGFPGLFKRTSFIQSACECSLCFG